MTMPLDTAPGPSPDAEALRNAEISRDAVHKARLELDNGDLLQASEKAWCAAAYAVKAVAERRRFFSEADWKLRRIADILAEEQQDNDIVAYYLTARDAHFNFYHHEYDAPAVGRAIEIAAQLVAKLEAILASDAPPPYVSETLSETIRRLQQPTSDLDYQRLATGRPPMSERPPAVSPS